MPIKKCRECGNDVSSTAKECPNCGVKKPYKETWSEIPLWRKLTFFVVVAVFGFFIFATIATREDDSLRSDSMQSKESVPAEASGTARKPLNGDVTVDITVTGLSNRRIQIRGTTNLPTNTLLMISFLERTQGKLRQWKCSVASDGSFSSRAFDLPDGYKNGVYTAKVIMPVPGVQPDSVQKLIGENGENLSGPLVENSTFGITLTAKKEFTIGGQAQ